MQAVATVTQELAWSFLLCATSQDSKDKAPRKLWLRGGGICTPFQCHPSVLSCPAIKTVIAKMPTCPWQSGYTRFLFGSWYKAGFKSPRDFFCVSVCCKIMSTDILSRPQHSNGSQSLNQNHLISLQTLSPRQTSLDHIRNVLIVEKWHRPLLWGTHLVWLRKRPNAPFFSRRPVLCCKCGEIWASL